jgi:hypothetical protein
MNVLDDVTGGKFPREGPFNLKFPYVQLNKLQSNMSNMNRGIVSIQT